MACSKEEPIVITPHTFTSPSPPSRYYRDDIYTPATTWHTFASEQTSREHKAAQVALGSKSSKSRSKSTEGMIRREHVKESPSNVNQSTYSRATKSSLRHEDVKPDSTSQVSLSQYRTTGEQVNESPSKVNQSTYSRVAKGSLRHEDIKPDSTSQVNLSQYRPTGEHVNGSPSKVNQSTYSGVTKGSLRHKDIKPDSTSQVSLSQYRMTGGGTHLTPHQRPSSRRLREKTIGSLNVKDTSIGIAKNEMRILMIGKTGVGKSATGNSILGKKAYVSKSFGKSVTKKCAIGRAERFRKKLLLVDTPGLFDTEMRENDILKEIFKCFAITSPGLHAILLIVPVGRFTKEEEDTVNLFLDHFGKELIKYLIVVFTRRDDLERDQTSISEYVNSLEEDSLLLNLLPRIGNRYVAFDNTVTGTRNDDQVQDLLQMIDKLIHDNGGSYYTNDMYKATEEVINKRLKEERKRLEAERRKEIDQAIADYKNRLDQGHHRNRTNRTPIVKPRSPSNRPPNVDTTMSLDQRANQMMCQQRPFLDNTREVLPYQPSYTPAPVNTFQSQEEPYIQNPGYMMREVTYNPGNVSQSITDQEQDGIDRINQNYSERMDDTTLREDTRDAIVNEEPGVIRKIFNAVCAIPGKIKRFFQGLFG